jgi:hypothetical protein
MLDLIFFCTGPIAGYDQPSICHSGKPKPHKCYALSPAPGREDWVFVINPPDQRSRDGWWCPACAQQLREMMQQNGFEIIAENIPLPPEGRA